MSKLRSVVFTGQLAPNTNPEQAAQQFAATFKVPEDKALRLIRDGQEKTLKKDVDPAAAAQYRDVLTDIGLIVRIDPPDGFAGESASHQTCPKCASRDVRNGICASCGVLVEAYLANQNAERKAREALQEGGMRDEATGLSLSKGAPPPPPGIQTAPSGAPLPVEPEAVPIGNALEWLAEGWNLFKQAPGPWIGTILVMMAINIALAFLPLVGSLVSVLIGPVLLAGLMAGAHEQSAGGQFRLDHLFAGFSGPVAPLVGIGALYMVGYLLLGALIVLMLIGPIMGAATLMEQPEIQANPDLMMQSLGPGILLPFLVAMALAVPLVMAYWFAPALIMLNGLGTIAAMKLSFLGCMKNILPFLLYGFIAFLLMLVAMIPLGLGLLVLGPVLTASVYASYRDIYGQS